jgi:hypothetical protein
VRMDRVAPDGTKLQANASKHKAMSYARLVGKEERVELEIAELEAAAAALLADANAARPNHIHPWPGDHCISGLSDVQSPNARDPLLPSGRGTCAADGD